MLHARGKPFIPEEKKFIVQLKQYFDRNKPESGPKDSSVQMTADALGIGLATVNRVMASFQKDPQSLNDAPKPKGCPEYAVSASYQEKVRSYIRQANMEGKHITIETIADFLKSQAGEEFHDRTLARTLDRWGFEFGNGTRTQHLKEKDYVVAARRRYLRKKLNNRLPNGLTTRPEVYLDESYVNKNHSNDFIWYYREDGPWVQKPTGNGERFIIMNAISNGGWVPDAKVVFKSTRKTGDYHGQMNWDIFKKWFSEKLIPNIQPGSIIVMDNAPYHNVLSAASAPTINCAKEKIRKWLEDNKIFCSPDCLRVELVEILSRLAPEPLYAVDEIAKKHGHEVLRTPPYHPELQPIEICWGVLKNEVARHCDFSMKNLEVQLENAFTKVTQQTCFKIIEQIKKIEDKFWQEDSLSEIK